MSSLINKVKKRFSTSGPPASSSADAPTTTSTTDAAGNPSETSAFTNNTESSTFANGDSTVNAVPNTESSTGGPLDTTTGGPLDTTAGGPLDTTAGAPLNTTSAAYADDEVAPDAPGAPLGETAPRRSSQDYGLDASKHKPSHFSAKLGAAEILHSKDATHQRRHGSIAGYEHYGSGNN